MTSISTVTSSVSSNPPTVEAPSTTTPTENAAPTLVLQETLTTQSRAFAVGLGAPRNHGDIEALFAAVAEKFGIENAKATDYAEAAEDAKRSTSLTTAAGVLAMVAGISALVSVATANVARQGRIISDSTSEISSLRSEKTQLEAQLAELEEQESSSTVDAQIDAIETRIDTIDDRISELEDVIEDAQASMEESQSEANYYTSLLSAFSVILIPFTVSLALDAMLSIGRASFEMLPEQLGLDKAILDATNNIADQAAEMQRLSLTREAATDGTSSDLDQSGQAPGGGAESGKTPRAIDILRQLMALAVPSGTGASDIDTTRGSGTGPETAEKTEGTSKGFDMVLKALEDALPPGSGDPDLVAGRAGDIAGALALLRGALGQLVSGDGGMSNLVAGATGRLNLAI